MKNFNGSKRALALVCTLIMVFSTTMTGCSIKKITKKVSSSADESIQIGEGTDEDVTTEIVVGDDGNSYVVDSEGNSVIYNPTSTAVVSNSGSGSVVTQATAATTKKTTTTKTTTTKSTATTATSVDSSSVYNALAVQRKFGFNKAYDKLAGLANFYLDTITCYFEYNGKLWLIELWKGEYAMASVGCEIGFYTADPDTISIANPLHTNQETFDDESKGPSYVLYNSVSDDDTMYVTMKMWQESEKTKTTEQKINFTRNKCWWAADFATGVLENHSDRTALIMVGTIEFPSGATTMRNLFTEQLEEKGFSKVTAGTITSYVENDVYSVSGNIVTIGWKNYSDSYQVNSN